MSNTSDRTRKVVAECLCLELDEVQPESRLVEDLGAESIDFLDVLFNLEKEFDLRLDLDEMVPGEQRDIEKIKSIDVQQVIDYVEGELTKAKAA